MTNNSIFCYRRKAKDEGVSVLLMIFFLIGCSITMLMLVPKSVQNTSSTFWIVAVGFIFIGLLLLFFDAIPKLRSNGEFKFEIYKDRIVSSRPDKRNKITNKNKVTGDYLVQLKDIRYLLKRDNPSSDISPSDSWRIATTNGKEYVISSEYGNPVSKIISEIRKLKPEIEILEIPYCDIE